MKKNNHLFFGFCLYILNLKLYLHPPKRHGALAQLVEQWTENPCVPGSIPGGTTSIFYNTLVYCKVARVFFVSCRHSANILYLFMFLQLEDLS